MSSYYAGVLITTKTFGRSGRRILYKCIPDNVELPHVLIPYTIPPSFNKANKNKYIVFKYLDSSDRGEITETLGDVDSFDAFCEYQLWRKHLNLSLSLFSNAVRQYKNESIHINTILETPKYAIEDLRQSGCSVFSIDPHGCTDFDDAFSVSLTDKNIVTVNVYIANVVLWLETFDLWSFMTDRVSTIYLPNKKLPLLPPLLSETLCSLVQGHDRFAFMMSLTFDITTKQVLFPPVYKHVLIHVNKNYVYEDPTLVDNPAYRVLSTLAETGDSHEVVSFWMIKMNTECAKHMSKAEHMSKAVFRGTCDAAPNRFFFENSASSYTKIAKPHLQMGVESYVHITSPIRRLVDILNQILFCTFEISDGCQTFFDKWFDKLDVINAVTKDIRRVQMDCELLAMFDKLPPNSLFDGVLFDRCDLRHGVFEFTVYIEDLKMFSRIHTTEFMENYTRSKVQIYVFQDETRLCRKIRCKVHKV
jgi:exoribonuclease R